MTGGADSDRFITAPGHDTAVVVDFEDNNDKIDLTAFGFTSSAQARSIAANIAKSQSTLQDILI